MVCSGFGCGGVPEARTAFGQQHLIDDVRFEGVTRFSERTLLDHLHIGETAWVPFSPDYWYDPALLPLDSARIEDLYRAYGYGRARVLRTEVLPDDDEVDLVIHVEEDEPTALRTVDFVWSDDSSLTADARPAITDLATLKPGAAFELSRLNDSIGAMRLALRDWGYPLAQVHADADVNHGARVAVVTFHLDPGPFARVRDIHIEGLREVPRDRVDVETAFGRGRIYSPRLSGQVERAVRGLGVFRWVTVPPETAVDGDQVDLTVRISEAQPQSVRIGLLLGFETTRWEERVAATYTHTNLDGRLLRLDIDMSAGWAQLPNPLDPDVHGPVASFRPTFSRKGLLEDHLRWTLAPAFELDVVEGYKYIAPEGRLGVSRWFLGILRADLGHNVRFVDFFDVAPALDRNASLLGRDFRDPYLLSFAELQLDLFLVDHVLEPTRGSVFEVRYALAGGLFGGDFDHQKGSLTWRGYAHPWSWLQLAARASSGVIVPYGDEPGAPLDRKFYLGGANSVRGWGSRRLSPRLVECDADDPTRCDRIPVGGFTVVQGNLELRFALGAKWQFVAFADVGDVQADQWTWVVDEWNYSAGPGLRFDSPVGLFRLDAGFRLNDPGVHPDEASFAVYFGLGETF